jgi:heme/copper-type cytochrome/quinol oxidase subunit 2
VRWALIVVAAAREALRFFTLLGTHGYDALDYKINLDWYSTSLFFITFAVLGGVVLGYLLTVAWKAGQTKGVYTPSPALTRLGNLSIGLLVIWIVQYFAIGFYVWAR